MRFQDIAFLIVLWVAFYWFAIRPQTQERDAQAKLIAGLAKDDAVVTSGGIHGKVVAVRDDTVILETGKGVHLTVDKSSIARRVAAAATT
jgi:preprotein translocase subunit YajC